jgi:hypothetical protein
VESKNLPEKIKKIMWLMEQRSNLTKDNMLKRNWQVIPAATSVMNMKILIIFSLSVLLVEWFVG